MKKGNKNEKKKKRLRSTGLSTGLRGITLEIPLVSVNGLYFPHEIKIVLDVFGLDYKYGYI